MNNLEKKYNERIEEIRKTLKELSEKVDKHEALFNESSKTNWGYLGDLVHLDEELKEINSFLQPQ